MQIHGGDIYRNDVELDYSANMNPFGMPESVKEAAIQGIEKSVHYPDIQCTELRLAIAEKEAVTCENIVCGNGAAEVIFQLIYASRPKQALLIYPTFLEYEQALSAAGCNLHKVRLDKSNGFQITEAILEHLVPELDLMFLCNPNNPTGEIVEPELLTRILMKCRELRIRLVIDECFQDFLLEEHQDSRKGWLAEYNNLFILKAFTKMYGMAGLRLGYGLTADRKLIQRMHLCTQPWNVSLPAQYAGIAACKENGYETKTREYVAVQREYLKQKLTQLGCKVYNSKANYIFFEGPKGLYEDCLNERVLIRSCSNYDGLDDTYYRIAVKTKEENERLIGILQRLIRR